MSRHLTIDQQAREAADYIASRFQIRPRFGVILGTGSGVLATHIAAIETLGYQEIPHFPVSTATGHGSRWIGGSLDERPIFAMDGRFHLYEGYPLDKATLPVRVMKNLGVEVLLITNASGGINPKFNTGEIMAIDSHIDLMCRTSPATSLETSCQRPHLRPDVYDHELIEQAGACARRNGFVLHRGVYASMLGPNFETRAEYRMLKRIGADVAGMSTVPEVNVAAQLGLRILALSVITNVAKPDVQQATSGQEVIDSAEVAAPRIYSIACDLVRSCT